MESLLPTAIFNTSTNYSMEPNTTNTTQALCEVPAHPVFIFAYSLVFLVSLVLNCITMRVYFCTNQRVQSSITVYMKNLAAADFLLCLSLSLRIASHASSSETMLNFYCSFGGVAMYINMYTSIFFMDFIAVNRYLKIVRPLETHALQTVRTARYISAAIWLSSLTTSFIYLILFLQNFWGQKLDEFTCESQDSLQLSLAYRIIHFLTIVVFIFVLVSLILLYWKTLQKLRQVQFSSQTTNNSQTFTKSKRNMQVLIIIFCVCFVPYHLVRLPYVFIKPQLHDCLAVQASYILKEFTILLAALNASLDPLIYFLFCRAFRAQFNFRSCQTCP